MMRKRHFVLRGHGASSCSSSPSPSSSLFPLLLLCPSLLFSSSSSSLPYDPPRHNEMLVPTNSTSALICDPVFNHGGREEEEEVEARWMRNGKEVARVNGRSNAILGADRSPFGDLRITTMEPIPQIGFLVIRNMRPEDEGEYWCERVADGQQGERTRLRVAYLAPFGPGQRPSPATQHPVPGELLVLECPPAPIGVPAPVISWLFNGDRIDFAAQNMQMAPNGSLLLHNFSANQSGLFACEAANFVGRSVSAELLVSEPVPRRFSTRSASSGSATPSLLLRCLSAYLRNGLLWFLIGCLTTSCVILAYILGALFLYRLYSLRDRNRWRRPLISAPGFRKTVAPMAERMAPPPYLASGDGASEV